MRSRRELASIIEQHRRELGMSQAELASRVGVSRQWVISMEAAEGNPSLTNLIAVLDALDLEIEVNQVSKASRASQATSTGPLLNDVPDLDQLVNRHRGHRPGREQ